MSQTRPPSPFSVEPVRFSATRALLASAGPALPEQFDLTDLLAAMTDLPASAEPAVVFAGLARQSVLVFSDRCTVDLTVFTSDADDRPDDSTVLPITPDRTVRTTVRSTTGDGTALSGMIEHTWLEHWPNKLDIVIARLTVNAALAVLSRERTAGIARTAQDLAGGLGLALQHSRQIGAAVGVLMALHKVTQDVAFDMLREESQRTNRKLRDIAADVLSTGLIRG